MKKLRVKILILETILVLLSIMVFVVNHIVAVSHLLGNINPWLGAISLWFLLGLMCLCSFHLIGVYFLRQQPLVFPDNPTPEQEQLYLACLIKRLNSNKELVTKGVQVRSADDVASVITLLDSLADDQIKQVARRVFVSTSIAQNGRLDSIIVFYQIALLIWKISKIYEQRPYPYELWKIYCNVLTTSMISFGIEQVDLTDQIGSIISPLFANSILDHVPVVKTFTKVFTHAILTGSANAGLVCRVGIVARNYMGLKTRVDYRAQLRPTVEATRMLNSISSESVQKVLTALAGSIKDITAQGAKKATGSIVNAAGVAVQGVADAGRAFGENTLDAYGTTKEGLKKASACAVRGVQTLGGSVKDITAQGTKKATGTILNTAAVAVQGIADAAGAVGESTLEAYGTTKEGLKKVSDYAVKKVQKVGGSLRDMSTQGAKESTEALVNSAGGIALRVVEAGKAVGDSTHEAYCATKERTKKIAASAVKTTQRGLSGVRKSAKKVCPIFFKEKQLGLRPLQKFHCRRKYNDLGRP